MWRCSHFSKNWERIIIYPYLLFITGEIIPFFTDYPYITHMDRPKEENTPKPMKVKETFFIKYILKPQPMSTGKYMLTIKPGVNFKVCKLVVTHIGKAIMIRTHEYIKRSIEHC